MKLVWRSKFPLLLILLAGTALRLFRLGADSLWYDETVSVFLAGSPLPELLRHTAGDIHPPGYYLLLRGWLVLLGYPTGHADPTGSGLEFAAGFFSLAFGVLLIALAYALARRATDRRIALIAAALVAFSPYNVWYSQEVRMYTLAAALGAIVLYALVRVVSQIANGEARPGTAKRARVHRMCRKSQIALWWTVYAVAAAAGMYTLYYFAFLLVALNLWVLAVLIGQARDRRRTTNDQRRLTQQVPHLTRHVLRFTFYVLRLIPWLLANLAAALLYAPWLPVAWRQATEPPVPPWRTAPALLTALRESWTALSLGQSAPDWLWPVLLLTLGLYVAGLIALATSQVSSLKSQVSSLKSHASPCHPSTGSGQALVTLSPCHPVTLSSFFLATFGSLALILLVSAVTPLYHVRYLFTYSVAFYVVLAAGLGWLWRKRNFRTDTHAGRGASAKPPCGTTSENAPTSWGLRSAELVRRIFRAVGWTRAFRRFAARRGRPAKASSPEPAPPKACPELVEGLGGLGGPIFPGPLARPGHAGRAGGAARAGKTLAGLAALCWLAAVGVTLHAFWADPLYRADDHRGAVRFLQEHWRPGDVVLVNAGYAYTALLTYWDGPVATRGRLTGELPTPRADAALVLLTTGHVDGAPGLGWADPRADFFAISAPVAERQLASLFEQFPRVWHYRIYDTVNDPPGQVRAWLAANGQLYEDQVFAGEANMRVQGFASQKSAAPDVTWPAAAFGAGLIVRAGPLPAQIASGETLYPVVTWEATAPLADFATSVRLVGADGTTWAQPPDEQPLGPFFRASRWPPGQAQRQPLALPVPRGTPPGDYTVELVVYDPATGQPWPAQAVIGGLPITANGVRLGQIAVVRATTESPRWCGREVATTSPMLARFGPLALVEATSPATIVAPGGQAPVELLWQAGQAPGEPLVVVLQLLDGRGRVVAGLEAQPLDGRYPTQDWAAGELVRDRHTLALPADLAPGEYRLIVGLYRATDRVRFTTRISLFGTSDYVVVKTLTVR